MKIIKDIDKQLNLNPQVIYLIMSSEEIKRHFDLIELLDDFDYTLGIFKFKVIKKEGNYRSTISSELAKSMNRYNMLVRLIDHRTNAFYYAAGKASLTEDDDDFEYSIKKFVYDVCKENSDKLNDYFSQFCGQPGIEDADWGWTCDREFWGLSDIFQESKNYARHHLPKKHVKHGNEEITFIRNDYNVNDGIPDGFREKVIDAVKNEDMKSLWAWMKQQMNSTDKITSDEIVEDLFNKKPEISVEIKFFGKEIKKGRKGKVEKTEKNYQMLYGLVFRVNGEDFSIHFGINQAMIYICTLLRIKMGEKLYLHEFYDNNKGKNCKFQRVTSKNWLNAAYDTIIPLAERTCDFKFWIKTVEDDPHTLSQAVQSKNIIRKLIPESSGASYYFEIQTANAKKRNLDSYYYVLLEPDEIIVPEEMQFLLNGVNYFNEIKE